MIVGLGKLQGSQNLSGGEWLPAAHTRTRVVPCRPFPSASLHFRAFCQEVWGAQGDQPIQHAQIKYDAMMTKTTAIVRRTPFLSVLSGLPPPLHLAALGTEPSIPDRQKKHILSPQA
jgi:hypothetical protein